MVDAELYDDYSAALSRLPDIAYRALAELLDRCSSVPDAALGAVLATEYPALAAEYGDVAAAAAKDFYERQRAVSDAEGQYEAVLAEQVPRSNALADLADALSTKSGAADREALTANLAQRMVKTSMQSADRTIVSNARRDPAHPKWALVPHMGACGYCVMLGSLGFFYRSRQTTMAARHTGCTCAPVADFDVRNPKLRGYDPDAMARAYSQCAKAVDGDWQRRWAALGEKGQREYAEKWHRKGKKPDLTQAEDHFHQRAIVEEMNKRDREWLQKRDRKCDVGKEPGAKPLKKEKEVASVLSDNGFNVKFIKEINKNGVKTADAYLNGEVWEFKVPEGWNGEHTVRKQFFRAEGKGTSKLLISNVVNGADFDAMCKWVETTFDKGDYEYIDEVLVVSGDGRIRRIHRTQK